MRLVPILTLPEALQEELMHWIFHNEDRSVSLKLLLVFATFSGSVNLVFEGCGVIVEVGVATRRCNSS